MRNAQVFKRHYIEMGKKHIKSVGPEEYEEFLEEQIPKYNLTAKAFSGLKSITKGFLKRAKKRKLIDFNVEELFQELDTSESDFKRVVKEDSREVFDENELPIVLDYLENELDLKNLGILLMFLTGIRVGELVTLKHSDFNGIIFKVQRTETRVPSPNGGYDYNVKEFPKTEAGVRNARIRMGSVKAESAKSIWGIHIFRERKAAHDESNPQKDGENVPHIENCPEISA